MSQLVAYYDESPLEMKGKVEIEQSPISTAARIRTIEGAVRTALVYVVAHRQDAPLLVPFGDYDDWSLRDRYNEAIRIMNSLGASSIVCETFREVSTRHGFRARFGGHRGEFTQERVKNSGFDFRHVGAGSKPRDPRPLTWPDVPGFSAAVNSVLENGSTEVEINIKSSRTHAIGGALGVQLKSLGFDLGGMSQESGTTRLHIRANFPRAGKGWK